MYLTRHLIKKTIGYAVDDIETVYDATRCSNALLHLPMEKGKYVAGAMEISKMDNQINHGFLKIWKQTFKLCFVFRKRNDLEENNL